MVQSLFSGLRYNEKPEVKYQYITNNKRPAAPLSWEDKRQKAKESEGERDRGSEDDHLLSLFPSEELPEHANKACFILLM